MRKILALVLAIIMMAAIAVPAFAEEARADRIEVETYVGDANNTATTTPDVKITYGVAQTYILSIPADITLASNPTGNDQNNNNLRATSTLVASNVKINGKETLKVSATSQNSWTLVDENSKSVPVDYYIKAGTVVDTYTIDGKTAAVLTVEAPVGNNGIVGNTGTAYLEFTSKGTAQEGTFSDFVTFTVAITEPAPQN